jgi:hypothetical protein
MVGLPSVMSTDDQKDGIVIDLVKQMIGESLEIGPAQTTRVKMVASRASCN